MSLIPALGRQMQVHFCEFEASLIYRASSRTARAVQRNPVSKYYGHTKKAYLKKKKYVLTMSGEHSATMQTTMQLHICP